MAKFATSPFEQATPWQASGVKNIIAGNMILVGLIVLGQIVDKLIDRVDIPNN